MKKIILSVVLFGAVAVNGQTSRLESFEKSYIQESYKNYEGAIQWILDIYDENSYVDNLRLGWLNYLQGEYPKSRTYYEKCVELKPESIEALVGITYPVYALSDQNELKRIYLRILKIDPNYSYALYNLASIYYLEKDYKSADELLLQSLKMFPFDYESNLLMARIKVGLGEIESAKEYYQIALLYNPGDADLIEENAKIN
ncbi:MAG TPA: hypothetical protein DDX92_04360 [Flavobacteriales bacterium]|jgi:tetratricopeptide (TPR) repeat protein|nr:hypothetical protein [Flavobacteriales bacterium]